MSNGDYYKVLWVEDDQRLTRTLPRKAEKYWLDLRPFPCWDDAQETLTKDFDTWDAIILDAKCKQHRDSEDNATVFLREALSEIKGICREKGRQLSWYVLTGEGGSDTKSINELITDERMKWDDDWTQQTGKKFYSKTEKETGILFMRVKHHANQSELTQIKTLRYRDVFEAMSYCKMSPDEIDVMADLLLNVHNNAEGEKANPRLSDVRKVIEGMYRSMIEVWGVLPVEFIKNSEKDFINITWPYLLLSGVTVNVETKSFTYNQRILTDVMKLQIQNIIDYTGGLIHTSNPNKSSKTDVKAYQKTVNNSPYLVYGMTMNLCNIILWFKNYIMSHPDPVENQKNWKVENKAINDR
ncbi:MAG: hypothetical protein CW341_03150 [Bacteroidetes bacterium]|nr:hypothetical protein [Bacteroidota bacterium]